ncbi:hypothetical protein AU468_11400 [Alkalispirochaeta sphaeroplastigenens]|uniref:HTH lacI-type domain-containing protein n=1 Tax=Alkalispirochaeta sphaeroplastigenens TaxID=1187066 RepID=A0A2S4JHF9_9SPIO|nr:LacI family DNA-binding transcriptional regulator [Alkalispirochaeta sphaeroplastigenens]POQ98988.1 hypothetical protein AU468_11400 [Alkalispirochaeta sphaeroplastigenens]
MEKKRLRSIGELAELAGVSKSTVSRVLNNSPLIGDRTAERIREIARQYDFKLNVPAQRLSLGSSRTIAFVMYPHQHTCVSVCDLFSMEIMGGLSRGLFDYQYDMLLVQVDPDQSQWATHYLDTGKVDGFVVSTSLHKQRHAEELLSIGAPFVAWGRSGGRYCSVCGDDHRGGYIATNHLISIGRKRIGFIGGPPEEIEVKDRYQGYIDALNEAGREPDPSLVWYGDFSDASGATGMDQILRQNRHVDAVFVNSDLMALSTIAYLRNRGLAVPQDVAVVGYDDLSVASRSVPALTTVSQNMSLAGKILARDLITFLQDKVVTESVVPVELVVRESA